jgi:hypothetical protein
MKELTFKLSNPPARMNIKEAFLTLRFWRFRGPFFWTFVQATAAANCTNSPVQILTKVESVLDLISWLFSSKWRVFFYF